MTTGLATQRARRVGLDQRLDLANCLQPQDGLLPGSDW